MLSAKRPVAELLVTDLDNTLWDWFMAWHSSFAPMLEALSSRSGVDRKQLEAEIRIVHQRRKTTEYSFLLNELPSLRRIHGGGVDLMKEYDDVLHVLNRGRRRSTKLYDGVSDTLESIKASGVPIVAYTESIAFWTEWRIQKVGLDGVIDVLYSSPDHDWPEGLEKDAIRTLPKNHYGLKKTRHQQVPPGVIKPNPAILAQIAEDYGMKAERIVYIGDSLSKDIAMAQECGVMDVHAAYGVADNRENYDLLRRVSHWTNEMIELERSVSAGRIPVHPTYSVQRFSDLMQLFSFGQGGATDEQSAVAALNSSPESEDQRERGSAIIE